MKLILVTIILVNTLFLQVEKVHGQIVSFSDTLEFEETEEFFIGDPHFEDELNSALFIIDKAQSKVAKYSKNGELIFEFGREGKGPGDLNQPTSATELENGNILVTEFGGRVTVFSSTGDDLVISQTGIPRLNGSYLLPTGKVLLTGNSGNPEKENLLYLFNPEDMVVEKEFLPLSVDPSEYAFQPLTLAEASYATVCSNRIVAVHSMIPELNYFDFEGNLLKTEKLNSKSFTMMEKVENQQNSREVVTKYGDASWIWGIYCVQDGGLLVQYMRNLTGEGGNPVSLMLINKDGSVVFEKNEQPFILSIERGGQKVYYKNDENIGPNKILRGYIVK